MYKYSEKTAATILRKLLKVNEGKRKNLSFTWIDENRSQCACDGYRAFRLQAIVPGLPDLPDGETPFDLKRVYETVDLSKHEYLTVPTDAELEALAAEDKANKTRSGYENNEGKRRGLYFFGNGLPVVNLDYLRDALKVLPDATISYNPENILSPLYLSSARGDAIILPVRRFGEADNSRRPWSPVQKTGKTLPVFSLNQFAAVFAAC